MYAPPHFSFPRNAYFFRRSADCSAVKPGCVATASTSPGPTSFTLA
jgi:hypothetical protein